MNSSSTLIHYRHFLISCGSLVITLLISALLYRSITSAFIQLGFQTLALLIFIKLALSSLASVKSTLMSILAIPPTEKQK